MLHDPVMVTPEIPRRGSDITVSYKGLLYECGADSIWLHYGFDGWCDVTDMQMQKMPGGFTGKIKAEGKKDVNVCFKDSASNWDNNNGLNWTFPYK